LERAKSRLIADATYAQDNQATMARWYGGALMTGASVQDVQRWPERIRAVTAAEVQDAARKWLDKRRSVTGFLIKDTSPQAEKRS
jgi:zinc protease